MIEFSDSGNHIHLLNQMQRLFTYRKFEILHDDCIGDRTVRNTGKCRRLG